MCSTADLSFYCDRNILFGADNIVTMRAYYYFILNIAIMSYGSNLMVPTPRLVSIKEYQDV